VPRLSRGPERGVGKTLGVGQRGASKAPGRLGRWLRKPFDTSQRAKSKSASAGRRGRGKLPLSAFGARPVAWSDSVARTAEARADGHGRGD
jgi:hypothetical protein